jgi:hypothetical protein
MSQLKVQQASKKQGPPTSSIAKIILTQLFLGQNQEAPSRPKPERGILSSEIMLQVFLNRHRTQKETSVTVNRHKRKPHTAQEHVLQLTSNLKSQESFSRRLEPC